ncbi:MAG: 50S ribosomal protein L18 [Candidatus Atribacteria bacterium]|nr:50S ribosomal protein L18 [Candidatus Atribacteria bacterium]
MPLKDKKQKRGYRHKRVRSKVKGTAESPRLCVYRSLSHIYGQIIDDDKGETLASYSTLSASLRTISGTKTEKAREVGKGIAQIALQKGIKRVVFDRGGNKYHGRVKALADGAREGGLEF